MKPKALLLALLCTCVAVPAIAAEQLPTKAIAQGFKDPESVRFDSVIVRKGMFDEKVYCGFVNAKNSYGGYVGRQPFSVEVDPRGRLRNLNVGPFTSCPNYFQK